MSASLKLVYNGEVIRNYSLPQASDKRGIIEGWSKLYPVHKFIQCKIVTEEDARDYIPIKKLNNYCE